MNALWKGPVSDWKWRQNCASLYIKSVCSGVFIIYKTHRYKLTLSLCKMVQIILFTLNAAATNFQHTHTYIYIYDGQEFSTTLRNDLKRFLDDCFIIWNNDVDIDDFFRDLNNLHKDINFTMDSSTIGIPFLDVLVKWSENKSHVTSTVNQRTRTIT